ncbi:MBL fold metallo-hydrolase [Marivirga arenosa]|uniref:MBL fold metallo-hydrolase n=1 Tax=Marivirga arenosa TaxID=3059076 RepID=A0AA51X4Y6_9BACT|nr:MBL fold metallo-hydrolase [Marivirga sp. BKB1-2]WNB17043.1 MBL fold metallo-hydrolase [Marivirga sp. BKB1-2]
MKKIFNILKGLLAIVAFFILGYYMVKYFVPSVGKAPEKSEMQKSPYYNKGKFVNVIPTKSAEFTQVPRIIRNYFKRNVETQPSPDYIFKETHKNENDSILQVNWLGHAAILLHKNGKYVLLDPMLGNRASPFSFMGPERFSAPPISAQDLPELDAVVFSHDHYDHLDYETIKKIADKTKLFYVPTGVRATLEYWGVKSEKIKEFSWWDTNSENGISITATPARHFSGRLFSQNNTFWATWVIDIDGDKIYFGGDTGIFKGFGEIDKKLGPFKLALLPIGAYNEAWHDIHMDAGEAVEAFKQMRADYMFPIHWGTFDLALHSWYEPIHELEEMAQKNDIPLISKPQGKWFQLSEESEIGWWKKYSKEISE